MVSRQRRIQLVIQVIAITRNSKILADGGGRSIKVNVIVQIPRARWSFGLIDMFFVEPEVEVVVLEEVAFVRGGGDATTGVRVYPLMVIVRVLLGLVDVCDDESSDGIA